MARYIDKIILHSTPSFRHYYISATGAIEQEAKIEERRDPHAIEVYIPQPFKPAQYNALQHLCVEYADLIPGLTVEWGEGERFAYQTILCLDERGRIPV